MPGKMDAQHLLTAGGRGSKTIVVPTHHPPPATHRGRGAQRIGGRLHDVVLMPFIRSPVSALRPVRLCARSDAGRHRALVDTPHRACRSHWTEASRVLRLSSCVVWCVHVARCRVALWDYRPHMGERLARVLHFSLPAESGRPEGRAGRQAGASSRRIWGIAGSSHRISCASALSQVPRGDGRPTAI